MTDKSSSPASSLKLPEGAIPAATLVIMRPSGDGGPDEILMVKRASNMAFAAGAVVFPGGRIDPDDYLVARQHGFAGDEIDGAARVAALRETLEETGLAVGWPELTEADAAEVRQALLNETLLSDILAARGERLVIESLVPFARWCPNFKEARTFDTRFYAIEAPSHSHELTVEEAEHSHIFWASAQATLAMADSGEVSVIFPTRRNLEKLAQAKDFAGFSEHAGRFPVDLVTPWIEEREGETHLCIPSHLGYPVTSERFERVRRG
ncbi:8-oxo-dGTP pyrophosphatase MutT (NUDIX family) [Sphingopyxis panaciterrae]|uniref:NUDIX hydrolase n=1 Tax=Sphingopyxis panaciterrae TaxID=363841 RepID=UPI00142314B2|nr:NUDIX domain-containing protein [Sphingopyxis panaciterrae]NIJ38251.1 8-oxo-dGTP pyrophosphatase MutT (NUDIX family) [Sphingopyxis panaciterrae]